MRRPPEVGPGVVRRAAVPLAVIALILGGAPAARAYVQENLVDQGFGDYGLAVAGGILVEHLEQDGSFRITDGSDLTALNDSMKRWTDVATSLATVSAGSTFDFTDPIDASAGIGDDGTNRIYFAMTDGQGRLGNAIAVSYFWVSSGQILGCDTIFNERLYTFSTATPANPNQILGSSTYDIGEIATHEIGHCLGLDHSAITGRFSSTTGLEVSGFSSGDFTYQATMYPYGTRTIQGRSLSQDDASGISFIYPNSTLTSTTGTIAGRVLDGGTFAPVKGAHVVAVSTAAPDVPIAGALSDVQAGGPGGEYTIVGLAPGSYYIRIEPLVGTSNPFTVANTHFTNFNTAFPWEFWNGSGETGFDTATDRTAITLQAGQTVGGIDILTNVGAPDPNEPNGTPASATPIACEQSIPASIVPKGDVDYYALPIANPTTLTVDLNASRSGSTLDAVAGVFDAAGNRLAYADNTVGLDPYFSVDLIPSGTYYVAVSSYNDSGFTGTNATTVGSYTLTLHCSAPKIPPGTCPGRVLYAGSNADGWVRAIADTDDSLTYDGAAILSTTVGTGQGALAGRRDGGVCEGNMDGTVKVLWDDTGDFSADRSSAVSSGLSDAAAIASYRRSGVEELFAGDLFGGGTVIEIDDANGDFVADRTTTFTTTPDSVQSIAIDEAGTVYVLDGQANMGLGAILAFRDLDGDGVADVSQIFLPQASSYAVLAARRPGEVYATDIFAGEIDRLVDVDLDGVADRVAPYATGLSLDVNYGMAFDANDVPYTVEGGNRVLALPDDDGDGVADRRLQFSPLVAGLAGIAFGPGPPEEVSRPGSYRPVTVTQGGAGLRLTWEDEGTTVPSYNLYEGTLGTYPSHRPLLCHVSGTADGAGSRFLDVIPSDGGNHYYLVTASDRCGEGSAGRGSDGRRRTFPSGTCGAVP
jgi:hypothetical protein